MISPQTGANVLMKCVTREKPSTFVLVCTKKGKEVFLVILL